LKASANNSSGRYLKGSLFLVIGLIIFSAVLLALFIWKGVKRDRIEDLSYSAKVLKSYYELSFRQWELTLLSVGQRQLDIQGENYLERRLAFANEAIKIYDQLLAFGLADTSGQVMTFTGRPIGDKLPNLMAQDFSKRSFIDAKTKNTLSIGEVYYFENVDDWIIPIRRSIRDERGNLLAVNTSALQYSSFVKELESFGFDPMYHIHIINGLFGTTQLYYSGSAEVNESLLRKDASLYHSQNHTGKAGAISVFESVNTFSNSTIIGTFVDLDGLDHHIVVSVDRAVLWRDFQRSFWIIICSAVAMIAATIVRFRLYRRQEERFVQGIEKERANLKALIESTNSIIGLFGTDKRLIQFNKSFADYAKMTDGIDLHEGMDVLANMKNREIAESFNGYMDEALSGNKFKRTIAYPGPQSTIYFLLTYNPIVSNKGTIGFSMFVEDITELKQSQRILEEYNQKLEYMVEQRTEELSQKNKDLEQALANLTFAQNQLIQSEKMASLGLLVAGVGHEINNPLNFIKQGVNSMNIEIEKQFAGGKSIVSPFMEIINEGVSRASAIVKSLSYFSRQSQSMKEVCDIHEVLNNCLMILNNKMVDRVTVSKNYSLDPAVVLGNSGKLHQAFINILSNSEQAIETSGQISIYTEVSSDYVLLYVSDTGIGIEPANLRKISDPFFTTKPPGKGTGLGLFLTYAIINEHKGTIEVESQKNKGTTFKVKLPKTRSDE